MGLAEVENINFSFGGGRKVKDIKVIEGNGIFIESGVRGL